MATMTPDTRQHYRRIRLILLAVLLLNWAVAAAKIIYGMLSRTTSITADGFHSLADGASNLICLLGIHFACQPKDRDHPYGHKKYETFFSLAIAGLLFLVAFNIAQEAIKRLWTPVIPEVTLKSFLVMLVTMGTNLWVMRYELTRGRQLKSDILVADALHTKADIFTSLSVIIALVMVKLGYPLLDPIATLVISCFIGYAGYTITRTSSTVLCDTAVLMDEKKIVDIVLGIKGVRACHKIRSRGRPDDIYLDLHVQVNPAMPISQAHAISYAIEDALIQAVPQITDVVVHMEPIGQPREETLPITPPEEDTTGQNSPQAP